MRCYFMRQGHIAAVEELPMLDDAEATIRSQEMFEARRHEANYDGFEVWDLSRVIIQVPAPKA